MNTGDVVLLANARWKYQFGKGYKTNHGSLTSADAIVPVAFGYLGATSEDAAEDDTLSVFSEWLGSLPPFGAGTDAPIAGIAEGPALDRFFGVASPPPDEP